MMIKLKSFAWLAFPVLALVGCGGGDSAAPVPTSPAASGGMSDAQVQAMLASIPKATAGEPLALMPTPPLQAYAGSANGRYAGNRRDPFALMSQEAVFEKTQQRERLFNDMGGSWSVLVFQEPPARPDFDEIPMEPQPPRRLVGILLGEGASALIQMEDGKIYSVRPGSRIGTSEWTVVSIDKEKAVIRREGLKKPNEVTVYLGPSAGGANGGNDNPGGNNNPGGGGRPDGRDNEGGGSSATPE